jgi:hypothetical protein
MIENTYVFFCTNMFQVFLETNFYIKSSTMSNNENSFFEQLKKVAVILIIVAVIYTWFLWCKEKPIRFLFSIIIFAVLFFLSKAN